MLSKMKNVMAHDNEKKTYHRILIKVEDVLFTNAIPMSRSCNLSKNDIFLNESVIYEPLHQK